MNIVNKYAPLIKEKFKDNDTSKRQYIQNATEYLDLFEPDLTTTDWQGGKLRGTYFKRKNTNKYTVCVEKKSIIVDTEKEAKKRELQEKAEKEAQMKAEAKAKAELAVQEEAKKKAENEQERAARKKAEKEAFEQAEIKRKQEATEKKEREQKLREEAAERIKQNGLSKEKIVKDVIQKKETNIIPVENIRTSQSEGVNYVIYHTFITLLGEEIEYKKIIFTWGGTYHKRAGLDIPNLTYVQELKMYGAEIPK
jgi:flagellar biosynthesis GTPase FlhF